MVKTGRDQNLSANGHDGERHQGSNSQLQGLRQGAAEATVGEVFSAFGLGNPPVMKRGSSLVTQQDVGRILTKVDTFLSELSSN